MIEFLLGLVIIHIQPSRVYADVSQETKPYIALEAPYIPTVESKIGATTSNQALIDRIGHCESWDIPTAKNASSTASGRFQFIKSTWELYGKELWGKDWVKKDIFDYDTNTELATYVINKYGTKDWNASKVCWNK